MDKFRQWYMTYSTEITWFLIGTLITGGLNSLARHDYVNAGISFVLAYVNYFFNKR
jgi:hypothetical protein